MPLPPLTHPIVREVTRILETEHLLRRGDRVTVAVSGGVGSAALAAVLTAIGPQWDLDLRLLHERGSQRADGTIRALAAALRLSMERVTTREATGQFDPMRLRTQMSESILATGETRDVCEAMQWARLLEESVPDALIGMPEQETGIIRPLLSIGRADTRRFLEEYDIPYQEPADRLQPRSLLERVRLLLFPLVRHHLQPELSAHLARLRTIARDDAHFLQELGHAAQTHVGWQRQGNGIAFSVSRYRVLPPTLRRRLLHDAWRSLVPETRLLLTTLEELYQWSARPSAVPVRRDVPPLRLEIDGDTLLLHTP